MQNVMHIATNAGHTTQNDSWTMQNDGHTMRNVGPRLPRRGFKGKFDSQKIFQRNLSNYSLRIMKC